MSPARFSSFSFLLWKVSCWVGEQLTHIAWQELSLGREMASTPGDLHCSLAINSREDGRCHMQREDAIERGGLMTGLQ